MKILPVKSVIPNDFTYMWNLKNKINGRTNQNQTHGEQTDGCQGEGAGRLGEKGEGIEKYRSAVTRLGDVR